MNVSDQDNSNDWTDLLQHAQKGDREALGQLCSKLTVRMREILRYRLWGWDVRDHEDIIQDVLHIFIKKLDRIHSNPHLYAFRILKNRIGLALRQRSRAAPQITYSDSGEIILPIQKQSERFNEPQAPDLLAELEIRNQIDYIHEALVQLSPFCRVFFLGVLEYHSKEELWAAFKRAEPDLRRGAYDKRICGCRKKLKELLQEGT